MADTMQHLLGQVVVGRFPLRKIVGVSANSAVFVTEIAADRPGDPAIEAAIKLIPEDPGTSDRQIARWKNAAALSHTGLLRIFSFGRCAIDESPCLYLVTELADENLGEILPQRALTPEEVRGMLGPVLEALDFLHEKGLVHGGVKPANILAIGDKIKLSADRISPAGETGSAWPLAEPYTAPEPVLSPASDIWSLGISLYETLTQYPPQKDSSGRYILPQLRGPFAEIVRGALVEDPTARITLDAIRSILDPAFVPKPKAVPVAATSTSPPPPVADVQPVATVAQAAAAGAAPRPPQPARLPSIDPLSVPLSPVSPKTAPRQAASHVPVSSLPKVNTAVAAPRRPAAQAASGGSLKFFVIGAAVTLLLAALIVPRMLRNSADGLSSSEAAASHPAVTDTPASPENKTAAAPTRAPVPTAATPQPTGAKPLKAGSSANPSSTAPPRQVAGADGEAPEVAHQVIPEVSQKALATIRGKVRVNVRVQLNGDGSVASADLDSPAPSKFFADIALKTAQEWRFVPSSISTALISFDFTNDGAAVSVAP